MTNLPRFIVIHFSALWSELWPLDMIHVLLLVKDELQLAMYKLGIQIVIQV